MNERVRLCSSDFWACRRYLFKFKCPFFGPFYFAHFSLFFSFSPLLFSLCSSFPCCSVSQSSEIRQFSHWQLKRMMMERIRGWMNDWMNEREKNKAREEMLTGKDTLQTCKEWALKITNNKIKAAEHRKNSVASVLPVCVFLLAKILF